MSAVRRTVTLDRAKRGTNARDFAALNLQRPVRPRLTALTTVVGQREAGVNYPQPVAAGHLRHRLIRLVNAAAPGVGHEAGGGSLTLDGANTLLKSLSIRPIQGGATVSFRVPARVRVAYDRPAGAMAKATALLCEEFGHAHWSRLDGCPEGYGLDDPVHSDGVPGRRFGVVQTTLRITVTVPAYDDGMLEETALDLLLKDLARLHRVRAAGDQVAPWIDDLARGNDVIGWDVELDAAHYPHPWCH